jgi:hypothetical protein
MLPCKVNKIQRQEEDIGKPLLLVTTKRGLTNFKD